MEAIKGIMRKWGSSIAIVIPKFLVKMYNLKPNKKVMLQFTKHKHKEILNIRLL